MNTYSMILIVFFHCTQVWLQIQSVGGVLVHPCNFHILYMIMMWMAPPLTIQILTEERLAEIRDHANSLVDVEDFDKHCWKLEGREGSIELALPFLSFIVQYWYWGFVQNSVSFLKPEVKFKFRYASMLKSSRDMRFNNSRSDFHIDYGFLFSVSYKMKF